MELAAVAGVTALDVVCGTSLRNTPALSHAGARQPSSFPPFWFPARLINAGSGTRLRGSQGHAHAQGSPAFATAARGMILNTLRR